MAKSLRSKWKRKCKAIKRERYGAKELERLKKTLGINENGTQDVEMSEISEIATIVDAKSIKESTKTQEETGEDGGEKMETDDDKKIYNKKTMLDQYGNYPAWLSRRKIAKYKKGRAKSQKANAKLQKRLTRRQKIQKGKKH